MKAIAIIPARSGSKRLPRKNILNFRGKPIIAYTIESALETNLFERVIVSTDDSEIANAAESFGAEIHIRPPELGTDNARVVDVCEHLVQGEKRSGRHYLIFQYTNHCLNKS